MIPRPQDMFRPPRLVAPLFRHRQQRTARVRAFFAIATSRHRSLRRLPVLVLAVAPVRASSSSVFNLVDLGHRFSVLATGADPPVKHRMTPWAFAGPGVRLLRLAHLPVLQRPFPHLVRQSQFVADTPAKSSISASLPSRGRMALPDSLCK